MVLSVILQLGMLPSLAYYFHRVTLAGPFANVPAVLLTGVAVPIGSVWSIHRDKPEPTAWSTNSQADDRLPLTG